MVEWQGTRSSAPCAQIEADRTCWGKIWRCRGDEGDRHDDAWIDRWLEQPREALAPIRWEDIREAASKLPGRTSAVCGWHPRHFSLLGKDKL